MKKRALRWELRHLPPSSKEDSIPGVAGVWMALGMCSGEVEGLISHILKVQESDY